MPITVTKQIAGYGNSEGGWQLIALPLYGTLNPISADTPIPPCTAVFVKAVAVGDKAVFTKVTP